MKTKLSITVVLLAAIIFLSCSVAQATRYYVDVDATGADNGSSWANAFNDLQDALSTAGSGDEIWVAEGTYKPGSPRTLSFQKASVSIYGNFGGTETTLGQRDWARNETILSGDIDNDNILDAQNSIHVVKGADGMRVDGFTITMGFGDLGGGMYNNSVDCDVANCLFIENYAAYGGGMANVQADTIVENCIFMANQGGYGGGMYNSYSNPVVDFCNFLENECIGETPLGGGVYNNYSTPYFARCAFVDNDSTNGGGMYNHASSPELCSCVFSENSSTYGGGIFNNVSGPMVQNCTFYGNTATTWGGAVLNANMTSIYSPEYHNCIFWDNEAGTSGGEIYNQTTYYPPTFGHNDIEGGLNGSKCGGYTNSVDDGGNINDDPLLADTSNWMSLMPFAWSPCIDVGDNNYACPDTDIRGYDVVINFTFYRIVFDVVDMGAFEWYGW